MTFPWSNSILLVQLNVPLFLAHCLSLFVACGHCKTLAPLYEDAAKQLQDKKVAMFELNCAENLDFCQNHEIKGYPTLKSFFKDEAYEEFDNHEGSMIVDYLTR